uniref:Uncharacterized protein n=1 Tax=Daphnia galeata TaxID=27404 RepID=A0A8J2WKG3_9CRUS|nr:unnamed protein product [Daphnia galeata]
MAVSARPRFLAVPLEDIQFINGHPQIIPAQHRVRRDAGKVHLAQHLDHETAASGSYLSGGHDNVDCHLTEKYKINHKHHT